MIIIIERKIIHHTNPCSKNICTYQFSGRNFCTPSESALSLLVASCEAGPATHSPYHRGFHKNIFTEMIRFSNLPKIASGCRNKSLLI